MVAKTLAERLEELPVEYGMSKSQLSIEAGLDMRRLSEIINRLQAGKEVNLKSVYNMAEGLELIAIVFYRASDGCVEDLGHPNFLYGEEVPNYVGEVFKKYRVLLDLSQAQIGEQIGIYQSTILKYEGGRLPMVHNIERIAQALGLVPDYLVPKQERPTAEGSNPPLI